MSDNTMPVTEANSELETDEVLSYELAYHVLPTVTEGEAVRLSGEVIAELEALGATVLASEKPERVDLAYEITRHLEGKNRHFKSAYFGWVRFSVSPDSIESFINEFNERTDIMRHLLIRLTHTELNAPFYFHQERREKKRIINIDAQDEQFDDSEEVVSSDTDIDSDQEQKPVDTDKEDITIDDNSGEVDEEKTAR